LERLWKLPWFKVLSQPAGTEENYEKPQDNWVSPLRFDVDTYWIQVRRIAAWANCHSNSWVTLFSLFCLCFIVKAKWQKVCCVWLDAKQYDYALCLVKRGYKREQKVIWTWLSYL
jgi:hypothetical protein